jgi:hypothetical protein
MKPVFSMLSTLSALAALSALTLPAGAQEIDFPARKAGQWEIAMTSDTPGGMPNQTIKACIDAASDKQMMAAGFSMSKSMCSKQEMKQEGDSYVIDSTCQVGPMTSTSHIVITGDFQSAYTVKMTSEMSGAAMMPGMPGSTSMTQEARWVSDACTDGMAPGDMLMPGGMKVNVNDMMKMFGGG